MHWIDVSILRQNKDGEEIFEILVLYGVKTSINQYVNLTELDLIGSDMNQIATNQHWIEAYQIVTC